MKLNKILNILNEELDATNKEYEKAFGKYFTDSKVKILAKQDDEIMKQMGYDIVIKKTDSDNLILKYALDDDNKIIYLIGILSKKGKMTRGDYKDYLLWIDKLFDKLDAGYTMITSPNKTSMKLVNNLKRKHPELKITSRGPTMSFKGDERFNSFKPISISK